MQCTQEKVVKQLQKENIFMSLCGVLPALSFQSCSLIHIQCHTFSPVSIKRWFVHMSILIPSPTKVYCDDQHVVYAVYN